jgi:hypothetical protein
MLSLIPGVAASAQSIVLQIRPHQGDTLAVRMEQRVEMTGVPPGCVTGYSNRQRPATPDAPAPPCAGTTRQMTTVMEVYSRAIVEKVSGNGARVVAVTDSIRTGSSSGSSRPVKPRRLSTTSSRVELMVTPDGAAEVIDADATEQMRLAFGQMPATLTRKPVSVGETWVKQMRIPISAEAGAMGMVRATFRLDSLSASGDIAYISMKGTLTHDHDDGSNSELEGWMTGSMQLDRRIAWITETRAFIDAESTVRPAGGGKSMRVRTRITQLLKARPVR